MKKFASFFLALTFFGCGIAHAVAVSEVSTYIDLAGMSVENGNSAGLAWTPVYSAAYTYASNNFGSSPEQIIRVWDGSDVFISNTAANAFSSGYTRPDSPYSVAATAWTKADGTVTTNAGASASTQHRDWFTVLTDADLTFTLDYSIWQNVQAGSPDEGGSAYSFVSLYLLGPGRDFDNPIGYDDFDNSLGGVGVYDQGGTLSVTGSFLAGKSYSLESHAFGAVSAYAPQSQPVPEPSTMLLLVSGLLGLVGLSRRRKA